MFWWGIENIHVSRDLPDNNNWQREHCGHKVCVGAISLAIKFHGIAKDFDQKSDSESSEGWWFHWLGSFKETFRTTSLSVKNGIIITYLQPVQRLEHRAETEDLCSNLWLAMRPTKWKTWASLEKNRRLICLYFYPTLSANGLRVGYKANQLVWRQEECTG